MTLPDDDIVLAGELVLGLLEPAAEAQARARAATDAAFAAEVAAWDNWLLPLFDGPGEAPPERVWPLIHAVVALRADQDNRKSPWLWQGIAGLSTAVAAVLAVMLLMQPVAEPVAPPAAPMIAALSGEAGAAMTARYDPATGMLLVTPVRLDTGALEPELWVIPAGGKPQSLGMIRDDRAMQMPVSPAMRAMIADGATLAVTPEVAGGAPDGQPTGAILVSGTISTI